VIAGIFNTGMFEYDTSLGFVTLEAARDVLGMPGEYISGVEATVADVYKADKIAQTLGLDLGADFSVRSWMELNANLFAALQLERIGMFIVLGMVILVGSFSIVTSLVMLVMEKTRDIAILMSMGATRKMIRRIFMLQGTIIGLVGTILGYILGISLSLLLQRYQFIKLPQGVYTIDYLPVLLQFSDVLLVGVCSMTLCVLATIYPARQAAGLEPAEALRYE
jgi:lipoprotein-releasing system permease protein